MAQILASTWLKYSLTFTPCVKTRNSPQFDAYVHNELEKLKQEYPQINYAVVLAHMPGKKTEYDDYSDTMLPKGIESVHPHYAISWRSNWMLKQSDYVVTYITRTYGGAARYVAKASAQGKKVINTRVIL